MKVLDLFTVALAGSLLAASPAMAQQSTDQTGQQGAAAGQSSATNESQTGAASGGSKGPSGDIRPLTLTCQDIVDTDVQLVPQLVYWIDGYNIAYNAATGQTDVDPVVTVAENWLAVPAHKVITACEATPERPASEVIAEERQKSQSGSTN